MEDKVHLGSFSMASSLLLSIPNYHWHKGRSIALLESIGGFSQAHSQHIPSREKLTSPSRKQPCSSVPSPYSYSRQYQYNTVTQTSLQLAASLLATPTSAALAPPSRPWLPDSPAVSFPRKAGHGSAVTRRALPPRGFAHVSAHISRTLR